MREVMNLKILTYNIHKGFDWNNKKYFLKEVKELVRESRANLVFLQEVVGESHKIKKKGLIDTQFEYLADSVWTHFSYAKNAVYDHGHHGNLVLSEFPIINWKNINISTNNMEKRGLLVCQIALPTEKPTSLYVLCAHLDLFNRGRQLQYEKIKEVVLDLNLSENDPLILAGDFNDWDKKSVKILETDLKLVEAHKSLHGTFAKTFPALFPLFTLDRIYVRNMTVKHSYVLPKGSTHHFSDHLPLFCEVAIGGREIK